MDDDTSAAGTLYVLLLEDQESDAVLIVQALRKSGFLVSWKRVETEKAYLEELVEGKYDAILSDYSLKTFNAPRALDLYRERKIDAPFIVVTANLGEEEAVELMKMGASDYLIKDRLTRLGGAVRAALAQKRLRDEGRHALQRLQDSEERFRRMAENAPDPLYRFRLYPDMGFEYVSAVVEQMFGYPPEMFYDGSITYEMLVHPDDRLKIIEQETHPLDDFFKQPYIMRMIRKDGGLLWTELHSKPVFDSSGRIAAIEGIARDITERVLRERERETVISVASALRDAMTRAEILPVILEKAIDLKQADGAAVAISGPADNSAVIEAGVGIWKDWPGLRVELPAEFIQRVMEGGQPYFASEASGLGIGANLAAGGLAPSLIQNIGSLICVPLKSKDELQGVLWVGQNAAPGSQPKEEQSLRLLLAISDIVASALHRARLFEETQQRVQHLTVLRTIDRAITASLDLHLTMNVLLDQLFNQRGVDGVSVLLLDAFSHQLTHQSGRGFRTRGMENIPYRLNESLGGRVVLTRRTLAVPDLEEYSQPYAQKNLYQTEGFRSYLGVPLAAKGEMLGVLEIFRREPRAIDLDWLEFVEALAGQVAIAINNAELFEKLQHTTHDLVSAYDALIESWSRAVEARKIETRGHTERVVWWTTTLARVMGMPDAELIHLRRGALLHDIGQVALPDSVLLKPGPLTDEERDLLHRHPLHAFNWLSPIIYLQPALDIPYAHHEAWDGSGYPRGLKGAQIPLAARIFSVVDVWDALCSDRPFRKAWPADKALKYIQDMSGKMFDPQVVAVFVRLVQEQARDEDEEGD